MTNLNQIHAIPSSKDAEMMVLGCMLTNVNFLNISCKVLTEVDFHFLEHNLIFNTLKLIWKTNGVCDVHLVCEELKRQDKLEKIGGLTYIISLAQFAGTSVYIEEYINQLKNYSNKRKLLDLSLYLKNKVLVEEEPYKIILAAQERLKSIERNKGAKDKFPIRFLDQFEDNFFLVEPLKKAMLLDYLTVNGKKTGFLPKGIVAMLVGAGGVGKTHLLSQLAISIANGTSFLDTYNPTEHCGKDNRGNVFFGLGENQYDDIHRLLYKATKQLRMKEKTLLDNDQALFAASKRIAPFSFCGQQSSFLENGKPSMYFREFKMRLEETAPKEGWALIILDPVSRLMGADAETDNAAATQFITLLEELTIDLPGNPTVLFAHHTNKAALQTISQNQTAARGSSALTDGVRWQCNYTKDNSSENINRSVLKMTKSNFTLIAEEIRTTKDIDGFIEKCSNLSAYNKNNIKEPLGHKY